MSKTIDFRNKNISAVEIVVGNVYSEVRGLTNTNVLHQLDQKLSYYVQGYQFSEAYNKGFFDRKLGKWTRWDGLQHLFSNGKFLTGLTSMVCGVLNTNNIIYSIIDTRNSVAFRPKLKLENIERRKYQQRVLDACLKHKSGIVKSATGSGKSIMIAELIANTNVKTMLYVIGIDLLYQMKETLDRVLKTDVGVIGDGKADIKDINVCTIWTAANALGGKYVPFDEEDKQKESFNSVDSIKIAKVIKSAEMNVFDECQFLAAKSLQLINQKSTSALYKFGFSGTPERDDNADLLLNGVCGSVISEISASELIKSGYLVKPVIHFVEIPALVERETSSNYQTIYKKYIVENEVRNDKIIKSAQKLIEAGRKTLILVKTIKHGDLLLKDLADLGYDTYFARGELKSQARNEIRQEFIAGKIKILIASTIYDQGIDISSLDALILAGSGKSTVRTLQRIGRVIRTHPGKKDAIVIDFIDNAKYLLQHSHKRMEIYRREAEFEIKLPKQKGNSNGKEKKSKPVQKKKSDW